MKTVIFIQVLYIIINFEANNFIVNGAEKCESSIETRAVLLSCPEKDTGCEDDDPLSKATMADEYRLLQVKPSEAKKLKATIEREFPNRVTDCKRKLVITMKLKNKGKIECDDGFIVIDHVYDPLTRGKARLLSPVIIKLRQEQMVQLYPLQFQKIVNSNPNENVFTKDTCSTYKGCSTDLDNPTCGITTYNGEHIPFSEGFCCSCDPYVNAMREVLPDNHEDASQYQDPSLFGHQKNRATRSKEKKSVIINPNLLNLKAENRKLVRRASVAYRDETDSANQDLLDIPPIFFFERDRQIVCNPEGLVQELYNLRNKDSEGKDEEDTNDMECNNSSEEMEPKDNQMKNNGKHNNSSNGNCCCERCEDPAPDCNGKGAVEGMEKTNKNYSNDHNSETSTENCKIPTSFDNDHEKKDPQTEVDSYLDAIDSDGGGQYQFTGNTFIPRQLKNKKDEMKIIEILHGKRNILNDAEYTRQRKKRLTRDNKEYNMLFQKNPRRNVRIFEPRKISNARVSDTIDSNPELCDSYTGYSSSFNCTLPIYFFSLDKSIVFSPQPRNNCVMEQPESSEYNEMPENVKGAEYMLQIQPQQEKHPPNNEESQHFRMDSGGVWDVNTKSQHGNRYRVNPLKTENSPEQDKRMNYENHKFLPDFDDLTGGSNTYHGNSRTVPIRYNYGTRDKSIHELNRKLKEAERFEELMRASHHHYRPESNLRYSAESRKNRPEIKSEMEVIIPLRENGFHKFDLTSADIERMGKDNREGLQYLLHNAAQEARSGDAISRHAYVAFQDESKDMKLDENTRERNNKNSWKSYNSHGKYFPKWTDKINDKDRIRLTSEEQYSKDPNEHDEVDLLTDNYGEKNEPDNEIFLKSKSVFFSDSKPVRNLKKKNMMKYNDHHQDEIYELRRGELQEIMKGRNQMPSDDLKSDSIFYKGNEEISNYDWSQSVPKEPPFDENMRKRRWNQQDSYSGFQKLRNAQFVRNRGRRSIADQGNQESHVKISKWEHRTPPGPEFQFDLSTLIRSKTDRTNLYSSGGGDRLCFRDTQKVKPRAIHGMEGKESRKDFKMKIDRERLMQSYLTSPNKYKREVRTEGKGKRFAETVKRQERGGQVCGSSKEGSTSTETSEDLDTKYESSHCMKLSDLWYSVYFIKRPEHAHLVGVQIYDKRTRCDGTTNWRDVTKGYMVRLGSFLQTAEDDVPTVSMTYTPLMTEVGKDEVKLDTDNYRLLIPSHLTNEKKSKLYPEFYGGPAEFLLVNKNEISSTGTDCNKIGTSFEAFARQPDRCTKPPGSCLKRQPVDLWREDMEARIRGKRGKYFIENFGNVSNTSIKTYSNLTGDFLAMDYYGEYSSVLEIEMRADGNAIVRQGENAQIPLVYIDSMSPRKTKIVLSVMNMGLTTSLFRPRLGECSSNLDPTWCPLEGPLVQIPPQQRHDFKLELTGTLPARKIRCAVEVLNHYNKKIASRRIIIRKSDRCFCVFYCKCICIGSTNNHVCTRLKREEFNAAGYFEPLPRRSIPAASGSESFFEHLKVVFIAMLMALLVLGLIKAIMGIFVRKLGIFGVQVIVGPRTLCQYYEPEICSYQVIYDECGFPIHPITCKTVQIIPLWLEMFINLFFFYLYFLRVLWLLISSIPCCKLVLAEPEGSYRQETSTTGQKNTENCSQNYFAYNVMTFTSKNKKPEGNALCNPYRTDEDPLEEDDTDFVLEEIKRYKNKN